MTNCRADYGAVIHFHSSWHLSLCTNSTETKSWGYSRLCLVMGNDHNPNRQSLAGCLGSRRRISTLSRVLLKPWPCSSPRSYQTLPAACMKFRWSLWVTSGSFSFRKKSLRRPHTTWISPTLCSIKEPFPWMYFSRSSFTSRSPPGTR